MVYIPYHDYYKIYKISYNKISTIKQNKTSYFIIANSIDIKLEKDKLDNDSKLFLKNLASNYKNIQLDFDSEQNIWNNLIKDNSDAIISRAKEVEQIMLLGRDELMEQRDFNKEIGSILL